MKHNPILVIGPSWVGDMIIAQGLLRYLAFHHPNCDIDVAAPPWAVSLVSRMPEVRQGIPLPLAHGELGLKKRYAIGKSLGLANYQQAYVLPNSFKSALIPRFAGIPVRTGFVGEFRYGLLNDWYKLNKSETTTLFSRYISLAAKKVLSLDKLTQFYPQLSVDEAQISMLREKFNLTSDKPILAIAPGAEFGEAKRWPLEYYQAVAEYFIQKGWQVWAFGSPNDSPLGQQLEIALKEKAFYQLIGKTKLIEAIDLLSQAQHLITNDSGLMHIGAALNIPLTALYGPTSPKYTPPLNRMAYIMKRDTALPCQPCFKRECPLQHQQCMKEIHPQSVIKQITNYHAESEVALENIAY